MIRQWMSRSFPQECLCLSPPIVVIEKDFFQNLWIRRGGKSAVAVINNPSCLPSFASTVFMRAGSHRLLVAITSACNGTIAPASNVVTRITDSPQPGALAFTEKGKEKEGIFDCGNRQPIGAAADRPQS